MTHKLVQIFAILGIQLENWLDHWRTNKCEFEKLKN